MVDERRHASEHVPYSLKNQKLIDSYMSMHWAQYGFCATHDEEGLADRFLTKTVEGFYPSHELCAWVFDSIKRVHPRYDNVSVPNGGLLPMCLQFVPLKCRLW